MKKITLVFVSSLSMIILHAQITFEHTYNGYTGVADLVNSGCKYYVADKQAGQLKLYNTNHTLWKSINLSIPAGFEFSYVYHVAEMLYSLDGTVGFVFTYYKTSPSIVYEARVINENGTVLLTVANATSAFPYQVCNEGAKLIATLTDYTSGITSSKVFSLPGDLYTDMDKNYSDFLPAYPNPASATVRIPYQLTDGLQDGIISLFDANGNEIRTYQIEKENNELIIGTGMLDPGIYFYSVQAGNSILNKGKLIIH